ncbi:MAG: hypothetical protein ACRD2K_01940, partial [Terriglobales bacterium]
MKDRKSKRQRGVALLIALFALMLLAAVAFEMMFVADVETAVNDNFRSSQRAYDAAWSGTQEVRERLMPENLLPHRVIGPVVLPQTATAGSIIYIRNPRSAEAIDPTNAASTNAYFDNELCHENFVGLGLADPGIGIPCAAGPPAGAVAYLASDAPFTTTSGALDYKWVRITMKANNTANSGGGATYGLVTGAKDDNTIPVCWDGTNQQLKPANYPACDTDPSLIPFPPAGGWRTLKTVYVVTSLAVTPTGARRMAQMEVALDPPTITNAAVDSQDHVNLNGQLTVNAYDNCNCLCKTAKVGGKDVYTCTDQPGKICDRSKYGIYSSSTVDTPGASESIVSGLDDPTTPKNEGIAQNEKWVYDIPALVDKYKNDGSTVNVTNKPYGYDCSTLAPTKDNPYQTTCGTQTSQTFGVPPTFPPTPPANPIGPADMSSQVTYVPGNLKITAGSIGNGILIVDGDLQINGGLQFYGLILVKGVISFTGGGANPT